MEFIGIDFYKNVLIIDAKLFRERRRESKDLLNIISNEGAYERKYKLLEGAYQKLLTVRQ